MADLKSKYRLWLRDLISKYRARCDYLEVRLEDSTETSFSFLGPQMEPVSSKRELGGFVRALTRGGWGMVSFNRIEEVEERISEAIQAASLVGKTKSILASVKPVEDEVTVVFKEDPRRVPLDEKVKLFSDYNQRILKFDPRITSTAVGYFEEFKTLWFANSLGANIVQEKCDLAGALTAIAASGNLRQSYRASFGSSDDFGAARHQEKAIDEACRDALGLLAAPKVKGGSYPVILDPILTGVFTHEAFGHLSEGDNVYENPKLQELMRLGTEFGRPILNIYDTGLTPGSRSYLKYDDEGVPTEQTDLIHEGRLVGRLHSLETAGKMKERPTGNARAMNYRYPPICRMRNTCLGPGRSRFAEMIRGIPLGVYAVGTNGGQTNGELFTFVASKGYMIRDGKVAEMVRDVSLSGNVFETLKRIDAIGDDFTVREAAGGCGKAGQWPLPTAESGPHIRIEQALVGGI